MSEPGGEVVAGAVVGGDERDERGAGLVGVVVAGLALEADGSCTSVPESSVSIGKCCRCIISALRIVQSKESQAPLN